MALDIDLNTMCESMGYRVIEHDNSEQDTLLQWMGLNRHMRRSILLVHHAGKSGDQRGASRREDMLDTEIKLEEINQRNFPLLEH